jgi:hypothetical protein
MTTTLADRYVWAAGRSVRRTKRAEFARELRERIGDATDALRETGLPRLTPNAPPSPSWVTRQRSPRLGRPAPHLYRARLLPDLVADAEARPVHRGADRVRAVLLAKLLANAPVHEALMDAPGRASTWPWVVALWMTLAFALGRPLRREGTRRAVDPDSCRSGRRARARASSER